MVKIGRCDGPVWATSLYSTDGFSSCKSIRAFFTDGAELSPFVLLVLLLLLLLFVEEEFADEDVDCPGDNFDRFFGHDDCCVS